MILCSPELTKFVPTKWELNDFDLKLINTIQRKHPFQKSMFILYKYCCELLYNEKYDNDEYFKSTYFDLLDKYYRYGICFENDQVFFKNFLCVEKYTDEIPIERYIIRSNFFYNLKTLIFNDVKKININDLDEGVKTISEIEKWKRKVIIQTKDRRAKLRLLEPNVYHSLITFVVFSKFEHRPFKKIENYFEYKGRDKLYDKDYKNMYNYSKIYEDKIYKKIKNNLINY